MRASVQPLERQEGEAPHRVKLSVEVDEEEFEEALDATFRQLARRVKVPGFRPGKVPRRVLEARIGPEALRQEALQEALPSFYARAVRDTEIDAIAPPEIDIVSGQDSGPVAFDAIVEVRPRVSIAGYWGLQVTVPSLEVTEEEVQAQLDRLRDQFATLEPVQRKAQDGDHLTLDVKAYRHSEVIDGLTADDVLYELGSGRIVPELDRQLQGARPGDIFKFNATVGPEGSGGEGGNEVSFQVLVKEVRQKVRPEMTDEWASDASEFDTLEELRADISRRLASLKRLQAQMALRDGALEALVRLVDEEPPQVLVDKEVEERLHRLVHQLEDQKLTLEQYLSATGQDGQALLERLREQAVQATKADLALRALAEAEGIEVGDDELEAQVERIASELGRKPAQVRAQLERTGRLGELRSDMRSSRALRWLMDHVELVDEAGRPVDRAVLGVEAEAAGGQGQGADGAPASVEASGAAGAE
ncbi:MAG TPA: trigger factor, partial [Acidimicrobiales bacterium]|nr:trigger factor [Acidimicrobiales bacterium]